MSRNLLRKEVKTTAMHVKAFEDDKFASKPKPALQTSSLHENCDT